MKEVKFKSGAKARKYILTEGLGGKVGLRIPGDGWIYIDPIRPTGADPRSLKALEAELAGLESRESISALLIWEARPKARKMIEARIAEIGSNA